MTRDQACGYVTRFVNVWRGGPPVTDLEELFVTLDAATLRGVFERLPARPAPTIHTIRAEYAKATGHPTWAGAEDTGPVISPAQAYERIPELAAWRQRHRA